MNRALNVTFALQAKADGGSNSLRLEQTHIFPQGFLVTRTAPFIFLGVQIQVYLRREAI